MIYECYKCREHKEEGFFHKGNGLTPRSQFASYCKSCMSTYSRIWCQGNKDKIRATYQRNKNNPVNKLKTLLSVQHIDRSELDFDWCWNELQKQNFCCKITGRPFIWEPKHPQTLSIDRINPKLGYTKENVRFVCWWVNTAMGNWGLELLKELVKDLNDK